MQGTGESTPDQVHKWSNGFHWKENQKSTQRDTYGTDTSLNDSKKASWPVCHCHCNFKDFGEGCQTPEQKIVPLEVSFIEPLLKDLGFHLLLITKLLKCCNHSLFLDAANPLGLHRSTLTEGNMSTYSDTCSKGQTGVKNQHCLHLLLKMYHCQCVADNKIPCEGVDHLHFSQPSQSQLSYLDVVIWPQSCLLKKMIAANIVW